MTLLLSAPASFGPPSCAGYSGPKSPLHQYLDSLERPDALTIGEMGHLFTLVNEATFDRSDSPLVSWEYHGGSKLIRVVMSALLGPIPHRDEVVMAPLILAVSRFEVEERGYWSLNEIDPFTAHTGFSFFCSKMRPFFVRYWLDIHRARRANYRKPIETMISDPLRYTSALMTFLWIVVRNNWRGGTACIGPGSYIEYPRRA